MATKDLFRVAFGGGKVPFGPVTEFARSSGNILTAFDSVLSTGAGPFKVMSTVAVPAGLTASVHASLVYTPAIDMNGQTVTVDGKTYTWTTDVTAAPADGQIDTALGMNPVAAGNLARAINLGEGAGAKYATPMTGNPNVTASNDEAECCVEAKTLDALIGNTIGVSEVASGSWAGGATSLQGGVDGADYFIINLGKDIFSLATSKANADAGVAVEITDDGTGVHVLVQTVDTLAERLEDVLLNFLTATGARVIPRAENIIGFWQCAIDGVAVHRS